MVLVIQFPQLKKIREFVLALKFYSFLLVLYVLPLLDLVYSVLIILLDSWGQKQSFIHLISTIPGKIPGIIDAQLVFVYKNILVTRYSIALLLPELGK